MTDEELAAQPGAVATRAEDEAGAVVSDPVFTPKDFRLNLGARLTVADEESLPVAAARLGVVADEPHSNLDSPAIRKLTWEHVVPDRPASSAPSAATLVPLPPPRRVPPPPPVPVSAFRPPAPISEPEPVERLETEHVAANDMVEEAVVVAVEMGEDEVDVDAIEQVGEIDEIDDIVAEEVEEEVEEEVVADEFDDEIDDDVDVMEPVAQAASPVAQPEVNRLASVPDLFDDNDDEPIELPPITPSGPIVAHAQSVYTPVLSETMYIPAPVRPATTTLAAVAAPTKQKKRKPKRHLFRSFMTLVLLFGLLAGGAYAARKYLLKEPAFSAELKPLADEVAATRGLQFKQAVTVTPVPVADYAARLAGSAIGTSSDTAPTWRALGLLNGELDLAAVGHQAMNDSPAFYDPTSKTIYVSDDLQPQAHLYRFALHRALTVALLDQQYDWSGRVATASPAAALALRATIDGDALAVANTLATNDAPELFASELLAFVAGHGNTMAQSQYGANVAGRVGVAVRPAIASMAPPALTALEQATLTSDDLFDAGRSPAVVASPPGTQGMMFWYYVLASRIDDGQAWSAATRWMGDSLVPSTGSAGQCVDVKIAAADADGAAVLLGAFTTWAATAPAESTTTVVPIDGNQVAIRACDPGAAVTAQLPVKVPVVFGGAGVEHALVAAADSAAGATEVSSTCLVTAARQRGAVLASPGDDAPVFAVGWQPAYAAANLDLGPACVVPAPPAPAEPTP